MGKHVCPICETVYATKGSLEVELAGALSHYECWECASCGYRFISMDDLQHILAKLCGKDTPKILFRSQAEASDLLA